MEGTSRVHHFLTYIYIYIFLFSLVGFERNSSLLDNMFVFPWGLSQMEVMMVFFSPLSGAGAGGGWAGGGGGGGGGCAPGAGRGGLPAEAGAGWWVVWFGQVVLVGKGRGSADLAFVRWRRVSRRWCFFVVG